MSRIKYSEKEFPLIAQQIRDWRIYYGLKQSELQARSGLAHNAISRIETGEVEPRLDTLERLAQALEISVEQLQFRKPPLKTELNKGVDIKDISNRLERLSPDRREAAMRAISALLDALEGK